MDTDKMDSDKTPKKPIKPFKKISKSGEPPVYEVPKDLSLREFVSMFPKGSLEYLGITGRGEERRKKQA